MYNREMGKITEKCVQEIMKKENVSLSLLENCTSRSFCLLKYLKNLRKIHSFQLIQIVSKCCFLVLILQFVVVIGIFFKE